MPLPGSQLEETFTSTDEDVKSILNSIIKSNLNDEVNRKLIISNINKLLCNSTSRHHGLELLRVVLPACPQYSSEYSLKWVSMCLIQQPFDMHKEEKLFTLAEIIKYAPKDQEFNKKFVGELLPKIIDSCILHTLNNVYEVEAALTCLIECMDSYSSSILPYKNKIEVFMLKILDSDCQYTVEKAAHSFLLLQQVGGAGVDGINHIMNFSVHLRKLCATIHGLYDLFFENVTEIENIQAVEEIAFIFDDVAHNTQKMMHVIARRLNNCLIYLMTMIQDRFSVVKETRPKELLDVILRGLSVHFCVSKSEVPINTYHLNVLLNSIQIQLLDMLRICIDWYQTHLLPFTVTISKLIVDALNRIQSCDCYTVAYKESVYKALTTWLEVSKCSITETYLNQIIQCILNDIQPAKTQVKLTMNTPGLSAKAKAKAVNEKIIASGEKSKNQLLTTEEIETSENTCKLALNALKYVFKSSAVNIKENHLHKIYSTIYKSLLNIQSNKIVHPYQNSVCQIMLYKAIVSFYEHETMAALPPIHLTIELLSRGANAQNRFIARICEKGLNTLEKICQPVCPSLYLQIPTQKSQNGEIRKSPDREITEMEEDRNGFVNDIENEVSPDIPKNDESDLKIVILSNEVIQPPLPILVGSQESLRNDSEKSHYTDCISPVVELSDEENEVQIIEDSPCETPVPASPVKTTEISQETDEPPSKKSKSEPPEDIEVMDDNFVDIVAEY
ncbi:unnamed protein product [Brassicogethes aeneus]|uniref:Pre-rRNA-processing protein RIX1 N-terminal domain-containing protein n=1 Tax=Brassicogethes aeneus TaxID=1431903 RepID=A0A9P0ATM2_BRAAE|nr:unnamed protein product [Brassicogethes aeneus]